MKAGKHSGSRAFRDLAVIAIVLLFVFVFSYFFDLFIFIVRFLDKYPHEIIYVDEVISLLVTLSVSLAIFAWRRWFELKRETAHRIKLQEELIRSAETRAETERIISKQLHSEIEHRKKL